jgi:hypothetical protein
MFLVPLLLAGCTPSTVDRISRRPQTHVLSPKEVLSLTEGNTLFLHSTTEDTYLYFAPDGRLFGKDIYNNKDHGRWDVSQDAELCLQMGKWWYGDLKCYHLYRTENAPYYLANSAGVLQYSAGLLQGDARSLYFTPKKKRTSYRKSAWKNSSDHTQRAASESETTKPAASGTSSYSSSIPVYGKQDATKTIQSIARDCEGCNLSGADLHKASLIEAMLAGADLTNANLKMANLRRADLSNAELKGANLSFANLPGANLKNADLRNANLHGANLIRADLTGANLKGAIFSDSLLEGVKGMKQD